MIVDDGDILALDLATNTGFCVGAPGDPNPTFGHFTIPPMGDNIGKYGRTFWGWLDDFIMWRRPQLPRLVIFCKPVLPPKTQPITVRKLNLLPGLVEMYCFDNGIRCREAYEQTVKKFFTGKGNAKKHETIATARRYGWAVRTDDEADACALWAYSVSIFAPEHGDRFALGALGARERF